MIYEEDALSVEYYTKHNSVANQTVMLVAKFVGLRTCFQYSYKLVDGFNSLFLVLPESVSFEHSVFLRVDILLELRL